MIGNSDLTTSKLIWNSVLSTLGAKFMNLEINTFYQRTSLNRYNYMKTPLKLFAQHIITYYDLDSKSKNGYVYLEMRTDIYGLPAAGRIANDQLKR